jgi:hypothetical protein
MAAEDWIDMNEFGFDGEPHAITCKFCGLEDLEWDEVEIDGEWVWRLIDEVGDIHNCCSSTLPAEAEDFEIQED